jgi:hypothetical protein
MNPTFLLTDLRINSNRSTVDVEIILDETLDIYVRGSVATALNVIARHARDKQHAWCNRHPLDILHHDLGRVPLNHKIEIVVKHKKLSWLQ